MAGRHERGGMSGASSEPGPTVESPLQPGQKRMSLADAISQISAFEQASKLDEADDLATRVLAAMPDHPHVLHITGIVAYRKGRLDEAIARMERSMELAPTVALYPRNMCEVYRGAGRLADAVAAGKRAIALSPKDSRAYFNLALIHYERLELEAAVATADQAIALDPDFAEAHFEKAEALLLAGAMAAGWASYEWRFKLKQAEGMLPKTSKPQWDGKPLAPGRLLLIADQGFGDCIQFGRLIPWACGLAPLPVLACSGELTQILMQLPGIGRIVNRWEATGDYDAYIPLSGLPRLAGITPSNVPLASGYLSAKPELVTRWGEILDRMVPRGLRRVGLVWAGRPTHKNDKKRTLKLAQFAPLLARPDIAILTVQKGEQISQVGGYYGRAPLINLGPEIADFADTMAILKHVERLVTIDTSVAHIAGATGVPTSLVLPYAPDWRWLLHREDTPWYDSVRLFRQSRPYVWDDVMERVAESFGPV